MSGMVETIMKKFGLKPIVRQDPNGIPPVGAILMISKNLRFIVKSHLRRNRLIIQLIREPYTGRKDR